MSSVRVRPDGRLFFDFRYHGERCRELSALRDTPTNRRKMARILARIDHAIASGTFDYAQAFPSSKKAAQLAHVVAQGGEPGTVTPQSWVAPSELPTFAAFAETWKLDKQVEWRISYREIIESTLATHLLPEFGEERLDAIDRASVMAFRSELAGRRGGRLPVVDGAGKLLAPATINRTIGVLRMIMDEAALRFGVNNPCLGIKRLKLQRPDITPFTVEEMQAILRACRKDYRPYLTFRFLTGVRSGEAHGLKWKHVDFAGRLVLIRETYQNHRTEYTKTNGSQRDICMSQPVYDALMRVRPCGFTERPSTFGETYVFHTRRGNPIDNSNFNDRVWKPLLRHLGIPYRRPYDMRHTCATLWLAAGESPEWIARQLGHTTTEMLFRTYSRFVPNLVHHDGRAFDTLVSNIVTTAGAVGPDAHGASAAPAGAPAAADTAATATPSRRPASVAQPSTAAPEVSP